MSTPLVHLRVHSHYSLLKALPKIPDLVARAKRECCTALALTDLDNLYGAIEFYKECTNAGIKPILGLDAHVGDGNRLLLYAKNNTGYQNLLRLVTESHLKDAHAPTITKEMLARYSEGILTLDPRASEVPLREIFYLEPSERRAWEVMRAIENRGPLDEGDITQSDGDFFFPSREQMESWYSPEELAKAAAIAERCNVDITLGTFVFPEFKLPVHQSADDALRALCMEGLKARGLEGKSTVLERLDYELGIIAFKGYAAYFLVVHDLIRFARESGIYYNIRGSVAGSMTTYLLQITKIDPLEYQIPFERFLNPERPSAPDIDMDFADDRRDEVIEYARRKYGEDRVAQIGTFGTMLARGVVRDVARALGRPYGLGDRIAKAIPPGSQGFPMTLDRALEENAELATMYAEEEEVREIIDLGKKIEGCARHVGVHAAGVVIAPRPLVEFTPLQLDPKGDKIITQYDMYSVGEDGVGLTKFDFLGIRNLTILASAVSLLNERHGQALDIETIPLNDKKTFEILTAGQTEAIFQMSGSGMTRFLKELRPSSIHDINAMVALYRPGPMQFIPQYIERKHNPNLITYFDPAIKPILEATYGILVYQDDLLIIANRLAGYSWGEVDKFRKAVGKKIPEEMAKQKEHFIDGCIAHSGWPRAKAERVWAWIEPFAAYGFNKAHAASYGKVAYQTAYLKANFPVEYMTAVMTAEAGDVDTIAVMVAECKRMGIDILAPDVNESFGDFTVAGAASGELRAASNEDDVRAGSPLVARGSIRFGLYSIKNFGRGVADAIIAERESGGPFASLSDFLRRITTDGLNKKGLEALIQCGALDSLVAGAGVERGGMLGNIERMLEYRREAAEEKTQSSLFAGFGGVRDISLVPAPAAAPAQRLAWEKELLGLYVSGHPLDQFRDKLARLPMTLSELREKLQPGMPTVAAGIIEDIRVIFTRAGDQMAFIRLADFDSSIEAVVFPKHFAEHKAILEPQRCIALKGRLSNRNGELSLVTEALKEL
ncbi:MAG: DNA polymerase III subunit alpha [Minisyncoccia bacterium]